MFSVQVLREKVREHDRIAVTTASHNIVAGTVHEYDEKSLTLLEMTAEGAAYITVMIEDIDSVTKYEHVRIPTTEGKKKCVSPKR